MAYTPQSWVDGSGGATPLSAARLNYMESGIAGAGGASADLPEFSTSAQTAAVGTPANMLSKITRFDTTTTAINQTLPAAAAGAVFAIAWDAGSANALTLTAAGADVIGSGSATNVVMQLPGEIVTYHCTTAGRWRAVSGLKPQASLDTRTSGLLRVGARPAKATQTVLTTFQTGHGWTSLGTVGGATNLNDTSDFVLGTQAAKLVSGGGGLYVAVQKSGLALDMTGRAFRLKFKVDDWTNFGSLSLYASADSNMTNAVNGQILNGSAFSTGQQYSKAGEWVEVVVPWGDLSSVAGTGGTRSAVDTVRLMMFDRNAVATTIHVNEIATVPESTVWPNGAVVLNFDDSDAAAYTIARPKMDTYGFRGVLFPIVSALDVGGALTTAQARLLQDVSGWEVGAHATSSATHTQGLDGMTGDQRLAELSALRLWQRTAGFNSDAYAYPNGTFSAVAEDDALRFYSLARTTYSRTHESIPVSRYGRVRAVNPGSMTIAQMQAEVDAAKNGKSLTSLIFHNIATVDAGSNSVTTADFNTLIDYIAAQGVAVVTYADVLATQALTKSSVGLGSVDNTTDVAKPISTATQTALDAKAPMLAPTTPAANYFYTASPMATGTGGIGNNVFRAVPWLISRPTSLVRIGAEVTTVGDVGSKVRLGIYADNGSGLPGSLVVDAGTINGDSATVQELTISTTLQPGLYWVGGASQIVTTTSPVLRNCQSWVPPVPIALGGTIPGSNGLAVGLANFSVPGALPGTFGAPTVSTSAPRIFVKTA